MMILLIGQDCPHNTPLRMRCKNSLRHTLYAVTLLFVDESFGDRDVFDPAIQIRYKYAIHG
jgi:hypothetical protein